MAYKFNPLLGVGLDLNDGAQGPAGPEAEAFKTIVAGNDTIVAEQADDTLTLVGGTNVTITGNAGTDTITIAAGGGGASALDDLTDVIITTPTNGQALKYNGTNWVNSTIAGGAGALDDLTDVSVGGAVNGDFLRYDSAGGGQWIDSAASLNDLSDTTITSPTNGQVLKYDSVGGVWKNDTIAGGGGVSDGDKGDITVSASGATWTIDNDAVTYAKIQNVTSGRLLGRSSAGSGDTEELTVGTGLSLSGGTLAATASSSPGGNLYLYSTCV